MSDPQFFTTLQFLRASLVICSGTICLYMGYRLFQQGIRGSAGDLSASVGRSSLRLSSAAPGAFFALLGTVMVGSVFARPWNIALMSTEDCPPGFSVAQPIDSSGLPPVSGVRDGSSEAIVHACAIPEAEGVEARPFYITSNFFQSDVVPSPPADSAPSGPVFFMSANHYMIGHDIKWQLDYSHDFPDDIEGGGENAILLATNVHF